MKVKELKRLLSYFSEEIDVVVDSIITIDSVKGFCDEKGTFRVYLNTHERVKPMVENNDT